MAFVQFALVSLLTSIFVLKGDSFPDDIMRRTCLGLCEGTVDKSSVVAGLCSDKGYVIQGRCCINGTEKLSSNTSAAAVVGIDLSSCGLSSLNSTLLPFHQLIDVVLVNNSLKSTLNRDEFYGLPRMEYLTLPPKISCPGGNHSWMETIYLANETICLLQLDVCNVDNFTCPDNSYCVHRGPGLKDCLCLPGFHGYKCLQSGTFETMKFVWGLCGGTVGLSAILWFTQRRKAGVKKSE